MFRMLWARAGGQGRGLLRREATSGAKWVAVSRFCSALNCLEGGGATREPWDPWLSGRHTLDGREEKYSDSCRSPHLLAPRILPPGPSYRLADCLFSLGFSSDSLETCLCQRPDFCYTLKKLLLYRFSLTKYANIHTSACLCNLNITGKGDWLGLPSAAAPITRTTRCSA